MGTPAVLLSRSRGPPDDSRQIGGTPEPTRRGGRHAAVDRPDRPGASPVAFPCCGRAGRPTLLVCRQQVTFGVCSVTMFGFVSEAKAVKRRIQTLVQLNLELAKLEGKQKVTSVGVAGGLGVAAAVLAVYGIGFAFATVAAGLSEVLAWWLSLLIVTAIIFLLAAIAAFLAKRFARKASPPKPAAAIEEAERTIGTLQSHV